MLVPPFLGYLHRADRAGEVRSRRHAVPQLVQAAPRVSLETARSSRRRPRPLPRSPSPSATPPTRAVSDIVRLALQHRFSHAVHPFRLATFNQPERPSPLAPPPLPGFAATTGQSASAPRDRYSAPHGFCRLAFSLSPPPPAAVSRRHLHTFHTRASPGSRRLYAGHRLASKRVSPRLIPGPAQTPVPMPIELLSTLQRLIFPRRLP